MKKKGGNFLLICWIFLLWAGVAESAGLELSAPLQPGRAVRLQVTGIPAGAQLSGELNGESFPLTAQGEALLALDMESSAGTAVVAVQITPTSGKLMTVQRSWPIAKRKYKEERLNLPPGKVELVPEDETRSQRESAAIRATYGRRGGVPDYLRGFRMPVAGPLGGVFGSRRILNGKARSPHNGVDVRAPLGVPIRPCAPGVVALLGEDYFFTGNTLVLDHGDGVISLYAHLERMMVHAGQKVGVDEVIGTVGKSGRATGPHLHWGVLVRGARVDPALLPGVKVPAKP